MKTLWGVGCLLVLVSGCGDDGVVGPDGDGGAGGGQTGGAGGSGAQGNGGGSLGGGGFAAAVDDCELGAPYVQPEPSLSGMVVTLGGTTRRAPNIVQVGSADCTEGLNAALLEAFDNATNVLLKSGGETIFCGCAGEQHALCPSLGEDAGRNITGELTYADTAMCNQVPCYELDVQDVCKPLTP